MLSEKNAQISSTMVSAIDAEKSNEEKKDTGVLE